MKKNIIFFILYILAGLISFFGYRFIYNSSFELGNLCEVSTECYAVTQRTILYDWGIILIITLIIYFVARKKNIFTIIIMTILLYNLLKIDTNMSIPFLIVLNFFVIILTYFLLQNISKKMYILNAIGIFLLVLIEFLHIGEVFYYNKKYSSIETLFDTSIVIIFIISLLFSIIRRSITSKQMKSVN
ncbi:hypothetical protein CW752_12600 [Chryseobacterium sp. PMSZPI]|nr:hypothetical protein CW752_12600 [Chryseobacterium sp. PMSZPI]